MMLEMVDYNGVDEYLAGLSGTGDMIKNISDLTAVSIRDGAGNIFPYQGTSGGYVFRCR